MENKIDSSSSVLHRKALIFHNLCNNTPLIDSVLVDHIKTAQQIQYRLEKEIRRLENTVKKRRTSNPESIQIDLICDDSDDTQEASSTMVVHSL